MGKIVLLDELSINKIAAGEVIERPASVIKEMVENSIDAGATNIVVEIKNGGISYIRVTDNGKGIAEDDLEIAFERHATSKIRNASDLENVKSMGFRGEALASIAAISNVEMVSKTEEQENGFKVVVEGGYILSKETAGCPNGTSITVSNLFFNTPVRYKFLKKDYTESGYIEDVITRIAQSYPEIAIKLISNGKTIIQTNGNGDLKTVIYSIYGKEIAENVININYEYEDIKITGVLGKPSIARSNRSNQMFFVNKRYVKDKIFTSATEQALKGLITIGKFAFISLNLEMDPSKVDVNVHPAKLEVRFQEEDKVFKAIYHAVKDTLIKGNIVDNALYHEPVMSKNQFEKTGFTNSFNNIANKTSYDKKENEKTAEQKSEESDVKNGQEEKENNSEEPKVKIDAQKAQKVFELFPQLLKFQKNKDDISVPSKLMYQLEKEIEKEQPEEEKIEEETNEEKVENEENKETIEQVPDETVKFELNIDDEISSENTNDKESEEKNENEKDEEIEKPYTDETKEDENSYEDKVEVDEEDKEYSFEEMYMKMFGKRPTSASQDEIPSGVANEDVNVSIFENLEKYQKRDYKIIGIVFKTYIIIQMDDEIYYIDQHAAHERVLFEKVKKNYYNNNQETTQMMLLPDIITLSHKEMEIAKENMDVFEKAGFVLEEFGENTIKLSGVPDMCFDLDTKELFLETLDQMVQLGKTAKQEVEDRFVATVACKAAVKAGMDLDEKEVKSLIDQLLSIPNPFTCPHGRPTCIKVTKYEIERKFSRK